MVTSEQPDYKGNDEEGWCNSSNEHADPMEVVDANIPFRCVNVKMSIRTILSFLIPRPWPVTRWSRLAIYNGY